MSIKATVDTIASQMEDPMSVIWGTGYELNQTLDEKTEAEVPIVLMYPPIVRGEVNNLGMALNRYIVTLSFVDVIDVQDEQDSTTRPVLELMRARAFQFVEATRQYLKGLGSQDISVFDYVIHSINPKKKFDTDEFFDQFDLNVGGVGLTIEIPIQESIRNCGLVAPVASNVVLAITSGGLYEGGVLTLSYAYSDANSDPEGTSVYEIYQYPSLTDSINNTNGTLVSSSLTYTIGSGEEGFYYKGFVTPVSTVAPTNGTRTSSNNLGPVVVAPAAPVASNVVLTNTSGGLYEGGVLTLSYDYSDANSDPEGSSVTQIYRYPNETDATNDVNGTLVSSSLTHTIGAGQEGTYFRGFVTPVSTVTPTNGTRVGSANIGAIVAAPAAPVASNVVLTNTSGGLYEGGVLTLSYDYSDINGDSEGASVAEIYRYPNETDATNDVNGTLVSSSLTHTIGAGQEGTYFRGFVTPVSTVAPTNGTRAGSNNLGAVVTVPAAPVASNVVLTNTSGGLTEGGVLDLTYTYSDANGDSEGTSIYSIKSYTTETDATNDANGTEVSTTTQYTILAADNALYFRGFVTPVSTIAPTNGTQVGSNNLGPVVIVSSSSVIQLTESPAQYIDIPNYSIGANGAFTIEALIKMDAGKTIDNNDGLFKVSGPNYGINFFGNTPRVFLGSDLIISSTSIVAGQWYHLALTRDSAGNTNMYLDGVNVGSATGWTDAITFDHLGRGSTSGSSDGQFDNFRLWSVERTPTEINDNQLLDITSGTGLDRVYNFENAVNGGTVIPDESGNGQDATVNTGVIDLDTRST